MRNKEILVIFFCIKQDKSLEYIWVEEEMYYEIDMKLTIIMRHWNFVAIKLISENSQSLRRIFNVYYKDNFTCAGDNIVCWHCNKNRYNWRHSKLFHFIICLLYTSVCVCMCQTLFATVRFLMYLIFILKLPQDKKRCFFSLLGTCLENLPSWRLRMRTQWFSIHVPNKEKKYLEVISL